MDNGNGLPLKRWNRSDDKKFFKIVRRLAETSGIQLDDFIDELLEDDNNPYWSTIVQQAPEAKQMQKKDSKFFKKRLSKLNGMQAISRREHKLVRKLLRHYRDKDQIEWEHVIYHFPGKRMEAFKQYSDEHFPKYTR